MKLAVCGDSWASIDNNDPSSSFSEILCKDHGWDLYNLARPGASNFAICLQIDQAVKLDADFVIISTTTPGRIEVPLKGKTYVKELIGKNIHYPDTRQPAISDIGKEMMKDPTIAVDVLGNFETIWNEDYKKVLPETFLDTLKSYVVDMFDQNIKLQYDTWIMSDACRRLLDKKVPFLIIIDYLYNGYSVGDPYHDFEVDLNWIPAKYLIHYDDFAWHRETVVDNKHYYHYSSSSAQKIADYIFARINKVKELSA